MTGTAEARSFHSVNFVDEVVVHGCLEHDELWVEHHAGVRLRPVMFDVGRGAWTEIVRIAPGARMPRQYRTAPAHGFTLQGEWRSLEHDWRAPAGTYLLEPPGEALTPLCEADQPIDMMALFITTGALIYTDETGTQTGYEDVFTRLARARAHFEEKGLDQAILDRMIH